MKWTESRWRIVDWLKRIYRLIHQERMSNRDGSPHMCLTLRVEHIETHEQIILQRIRALEAKL